MAFRLCDSSYEFLNEPSDYTPSCTQSKQIVYDCHVSSYGSLVDPYYRSLCHIFECLMLNFDV